MKVLVTGGAGFIGSHLCERLLADGHEVLCVDNLLTGTLENVAPLRSRPRFTFLEHNVSQPLDIPGELGYVLHFASPASPPDYLKYPIQTLKVGSMGTLNGLGLAKAKQARFLLASTSEVYGDPAVHPQPETYWGHVNPVGPRGVYDEAKRFAEAITMAYRREHGVDTRIVRIFNTYGPRMRLADGRAIPNFLTQVLRNEPVTIYGDGSHTRSFCYVQDLVEGIIRLMACDYAEPVNLGNPEEHTILEMAEYIIAFTRSKSRLVFHPQPQDDPKQRCPDIGLAKRLLHWQPATPLAEGLRKTLEWFATQMSIPDALKSAGGPS